MKRHQVGTISAVAAIMMMTGLAGAQEAPAAAPLKVGDPAPAFKVARWFKGSPVEELKEGHVYVMEFWATWCGPCIQAMPHLTELAKKHQGKATIIGVSVWERPTTPGNEAIFDLVGPFVDKQGDKMVYNVAADGVDGLMARTWLSAAGQNGIPCTFIIGKDRKIAWIGHPMTMDKVLEEVIAGTWDVKAEALRFEKANQEKLELQALVKPVQDALSAKDYRALVPAIDKVIAARPELGEQLIPVRFDALLHFDEAGAYAYLKDLADKGAFAKTPALAYNLWMAVTRAIDSLKSPDWPGLETALRAANSGERQSAPILAAYADVLMKTGKVAQAIEIQEKVLAEAQRPGSSLSASWIEAQKKTLDEYKSRRP